jgi:CDP-diacylglycerol---glycerol-3-phosphate 3-phosphatidyltransferase
MLDRFKAFWQRLLTPIARLLIRLGVSADAVTLVGTVGVTIGALVFFPQGRLLAGVLFITAFVFSDVLDGHMARMSGTTSKFGAFWDSTLDRIGDGAIFGGLVLYYAGPGDSRLYLGLSLACLVLGTVTSYARARAESLGFTAAVGIAERADRVAAILLMTGLSAIFGLPILMEATLWLLSVASLVTVGMRIAVVRRQAVAEAASGGTEHRREEPGESTP